MKKKLLPILLVCMFGLIACGGEKKPDPKPDPEPQVVSVTGVSLDQSSLELMVGEYKTLVATVQPADADNKAVKWSSDAPTTASVDENGKVTALQAGSANITVTTVDGNKTALCAVTVKPIAYSIEITNKTELQAEWAQGTSQRSLSLSISPKGNLSALINSGDITISSSAPNVIAASGLMLNPVGVGSATITVNYHDASDSVDLTVSGITYDTIEECVTKTLAKDPETFEKKEWCLKGTVTAILGNTFVIQEGNFGFYVYNKAIEGIAVGKVVSVVTTATLYNGLVESKSISSATLLDEAGAVITPKTLDNLGVIVDTDVNLLGSVNGLKAEGTSARATTSSYRTCYVSDSSTSNGNQKYAIYVNKYIPEADINAINDVLDQFENGAYTLNVKGALISAYNTADKGNCYQFVPTSADQLELVAAASVNPTAINVTAKETSIKAGLTTTVSATFEPENCNQKAITWTSSDEAVATVDQTGLVKGVSAGEVTITATSDVVSTVSGSVTITVTSALKPVGIAVPEDGCEYYFGVDYEGYSFLTGGFGNYCFSMDPDRSNAAKVLLEKNQDGTYNLSTKIENAKKYLRAYVSGNYINVEFSDDPCAFTYDAENQMFTISLAKGEAAPVTYYLGRQYKGNGITANDIKYLTDAADAPARILLEQSLQPVNPTDGAEGYLGFDYSGKLFLDGGFANYCFTVNADEAKASLVKVEANQDGTFNLSTTIGEAKKYLRAYASGNYINVEFSDDPCAFTYDAENQMFTISLAKGEAAPVTYYLGRQYKGNGITANDIKYLTDAADTPAHFYQLATNKPVKPTPLPAGVVATFEFGENGEAKHDDGTEISSYTETSGDFTLNLTCSKVYKNARDAKGNSALKLATGKATASLEFTVLNSINQVKIYVANYKGNTGSISINDVEYDLIKKSDEGEYDVITIDCSSVKKISLLTGIAGDKRCMINTIEFLNVE